jgi:hypothetical protein
MPTILIRPIIELMKPGRVCLDGKSSNMQQVDDLKTAKPKRHAPCTNCQPSNRINESFDQNLKCGNRDAPLNKRPA